MRFIHNVEGAENNEPSNTTPNSSTGEYDVRINLDDLHVTEAWSYESNSIEEMETPMFLVVGHELIHAMNYITGAVDNWNMKYTGVNVVVRPGGEVEYYQERLEEIRTIGRSYYDQKEFNNFSDPSMPLELKEGAVLKSYDVLYSENILRAEHFLGERYYHEADNKIER